MRKPERDESLNLHFYPSPFRHESRILKETHTLIKHNIVDKICIIARWEPGLKEEESIDDNRSVWRVKLFCSRFPKSLPLEVVKYLEMSLRIFARFFGIRVAVVSVHSLSTLPIGVLFKWSWRSKLIYDTHELETERTGLNGIRQKFSKFTERLCMPFVDKMVVTSDSYANCYKETYGLQKIYVFKNMPYLNTSKPSEKNYFREKFNIQKDDIIFLYHGLLSKGRAINLLLNSFARLPENKHLVLMGFGDLVPLVKNYESKYSNIHYHESVHPEQVVEYASNADVGISLIQKSSLSYYYSMPNKIYEYIHSGLAIIVSDFPDMGRVVEEAGCGWKIKVCEEDFYNLVSKLTPGEIKQKRNQSNANRHHYCWSKQEHIVKEAYNF